MIKNKNNLVNIAYWIMIVVVIAFCFFLYFYLTGEAKQCLSDPLKYYEFKTNAQCFCVGKIIP